MADETLRECPACRQSRPYYDSETRGGVTLYAVACNICGHRTGWHSTRAIADTGWNTRVTDPALAAAQAEIARLKGELAEAIRDAECLVGEVALLRVALENATRDDVSTWAST